MQNLNNILINLGFQFQFSNSLSKSYTLMISCDGLYTKKYITSMGNFIVGINIQDDHHTQLPTAYVLKFPEGLSDQLLPHINLGGYLCYIQEMEAEWDPNFLSDTYSLIDQMIQGTLDTIIESLSNETLQKEEIEGELAAYWNPKIYTYLLTTSNKKQKLFSKELQKNGKSKELVTYEQEQINCNKWVNLRSLTMSGSSIITRYISVRPNKLSADKWPIESFKDILQWLQKIDYQSVIRIIDCLIRAPKKKNIFILDIQSQDIIAFNVELNLKVLPLKRNKNNKKTNYSSLVKSLSNLKASKNFFRIGVRRADDNILLSRNNKRAHIGDLRHKKIALIGCGTIGGYLAPLLLRSGAGCGHGFLELFDFDIFQGHNFSRHALGSTHIGQFKATALKKYLQNSTHLPTKILDTKFTFSVSENILKKYDLIIDTTGRLPLSLRLAKVSRMLPKNSRPIIIHSFNDGNGRASKVFIDNGTACYNCLLETPRIFNQNGHDPRFFSFDLEREKKISCGSTFTPYDAAVSVVTAGITQEAVLSTLEPSFDWTYKEHLFEGSGRTHRPVIISKKSSCYICKINE